MDGVLEGRRVLVTGASSGIGEGAARAAAAAGARVALLARREPAVRALAEELGGVAVPADVTDLSAAAAAVDAAAAALGGLDAVVNAAGAMRPGLVADTDPEAWRAMYDVNVVGLLGVAHAAIPHLRRGTAPAIVNVSSLSGRRVPRPTGGIYASTKFAVHALSESLRAELQDDGIRVTILAPGFVDTDLFAGLEEGPLKERYSRATRETGLPVADVAAAIVHVLAQPAHVALVEVALSSIVQRPPGTS